MHSCHRNIAFCRGCSRGNRVPWPAPAPLQSSPGSCWSWSTGSRRRASPWPANQHYQPRTASRGCGLGLRSLAALSRFVGTSTDRAAGPRRCDPSPNDDFTGAPVEVTAGRCGSVWFGWSPSRSLLVSIRASSRRSARSLAGSESAKATVAVRHESWSSGPLCPPARTRSRCPRRRPAPSCPRPR